MEYLGKQNAQHVRMPHKPTKAGMGNEMRLRALFQRQQVEQSAHMRHMASRPPDSQHHYLVRMLLRTVSLPGPQGRLQLLLFI